MDAPAGITERSAPAGLAADRTRSVVALRAWSGRLLVLAIAACALALRLHGIDWDQGHFFQPDERFVIQFKLPQLAPLWPFDLSLALDPVRSPWNPHWFAYGSFPLYLLKGLEQMALLFDPAMSPDSARFLGRFVSAAADTGTLLLLYLLGCRLYDRRAALLAAAFAALAVLPIQLSHFSTFDVALAFWVTAALYAATHVLLDGGWRWSLFCGVAVGLGLATKVSILPIAIPIAFAHLAPSMPRLSQRRDHPLRHWYAGAGRLAVAGLLAAAVFVIAQPYALLDAATFLRDVREQSDMATRRADLPYTRQYIDTAPYLYPIQQFTLWGVGVPLGIVAWLGFGFTLWQASRHRRAGDLLLLSWVVPYFVITGSFPVKYMRYLLPMTPFLLLMGARMLVAWRDAWASRGDAAIWRPLKGAVTRRWLRYAPGLVTALVLLTTAWYALAFENIYNREHPAVAMSRWIRANVPAGALILKEHWEEGVPDLAVYRQDELKLYEPDSEPKLAEIARQLQSADYILFFSNRLYGTIPRLPERYPSSTRYYQLLFSGQLGYRLIHVSDAYPAFLGVEWRDDTFSRPRLPVPAGAETPPQGLLTLRLGYADESFTVYDHPKLLLFQKVNPLSATQIRELLGPPSGSAALGTQGRGLMLTPAQAAAQQAGGTWTAIFPENAPGRAAPVLVWLLAVEALGLAAFPLAFRLFSAFPDRGWLPAKLLGLLFTAYLAWLAASLGTMPFTFGSIAGAAALLILAGAVAFWRQSRSVLTWLRARWRLPASFELVFLLAFLAFLLLRALNPDLWHPARGGEKPMDLAFLNAIVKSSYMPPYDPWFSGGYLNYYYFGHFLVATLVKLTMVPTEVAYNLAIPTLFAMLAGGACSVGAALAAGGGPLGPAVARAPRRLTEARRSMARRGQGEEVPRSGKRLLAGGLTALVLVGVAGNLDGAAQLLDGLSRISGVEVHTTLPGVAGIVSVAVALVKLPFSGPVHLAFDYWRSSRMGGMDPSFIDPSIRAPSLSISEFPFFTYLFADLHAHLVAMPLAILSIGLAVQLVMGTRTDRLPARLALLAVFGLVLGALRWTNSWDYPTYLLLGLLAIAIMEWSSRRRLDGWAAARIACYALLLFGTGLLLFRPLQTSYELFFGGGLAPSPEQTPLGVYLRIHGLFLFITAGFVAHELQRRYGWLGCARVAAMLWRQRYRAGRAWRLYRRLRLVDRSDIASGIALGWAGAAAILVLLLWTLGAATSGFLAVLLGLLALLVVAELQEPSDRSGLYLLVLGMAAAAAGLSLLVEAVKFDIPGEVQRMNNVFKLYLQVWVLYALSACYMLWWAIESSKSKSSKFEVERSTFRTRSSSLGPGATAARVPLPPRMARPGAIMRAWQAGVALLVGAALVYPLFATPVRLADRFAPLPPTLDGMAYMHDAVQREQDQPVALEWDYQAIRWLQQNVPGSPVIVEAVTPIYHWGSRVAIYTGLPAVLGWDWHETQQRWTYQPLVDERKRDVAAIYGSTDPAATMALLHKYGVRYLYLGRLERIYYAGPGLDKFPIMASGGMLRAVYQNPDVTVYEVTG